MIIAQPQVEIDEAIREAFLAEPEKCTIVHCRHYAEEPSGIRIWPSTFLVENNGSRKKLIKAFNISLMPQWTFHLVAHEFIRFTLVFEGLSAGCNQLYLLEDILQPGAFFSEPFSRNDTDVYNVEVFC